MEPSKGAASTPERGLVCPKCGRRHFFVVYTRRAAGEKLVRRRECRHCGRRITTWERLIGR
jgi:transcriptional regulator NrdR family protein